MVPVRQKPPENPTLDKLGAKYCSVAPKIAKHHSGLLPHLGALE
jgi:hypothetical protein